MFKPIILVALVCGLAQLISAQDELDCEGVKQISFEDMKQGDNICHLLYEKTEKDYSAAAFDKMRVCACNLVNKGFVWSSLFSQAKQLDYLIEARRALMGAAQGKTLAEFPASAFAQYPKQEVRKRLEKIDRMYGDGKTVEQGCRNFVAQFAEFNKMFQNLAHFAGNQLLSLVLAKQPKVRNLFDVYAVCAKADY